MIKYSRPTSKVHVIWKRLTQNMVLHSLETCFEASNTILKCKQNKDIRKVNLGTCYLAFTLHYCVMVYAAAIYTSSSQNWIYVSFHVHVIPTPNINMFIQLELTYWSLKEYHSSFCQSFGS